MPAVPGPRPDQIQQIGANPGDVIAAGADSFFVEGRPSFQPGTGGSGGVSVGTISKSIILSDELLDTTPIPDAGTIGDFSTNIYVNGEARGERLSFHVPDSYDSGNLEFLAVYRMSSEDPAATLSLEADVTIADVTTGQLTVATGPVAILFDPDGPNQTGTDTLIHRSVLFSISEGSFSTGDSIAISLKRLGDVDLHSGDWEVIVFQYRFVGQVATRAITQSAIIFEPTDEPTPTKGVLGDFNTLDYPSVTGGDAEQKTVFIVPDNWDGASDIHIRQTYAMSVADTASVLIETEGSIADVETGTIIELSTVPFILLPPADTGVDRSVIIRSIPAGLLSVGSAIALKHARRSVDPTDVHSGDMKLINLTITTNGAPSTGFTTPKIEWKHLSFGHSKAVSGAVTRIETTPDFTGDFQQWDQLHSTSPGGEIHIVYEGRLNKSQSKIAEVSVPIKGTGSYKLKIYGEDTSTDNIIFENGVSGPLTAPTARTVVLVAEGDFSSMPRGEGRYYVVIEAFLEAGEDIYVGLPFVKQE